MKNYIEFKCKHCGKQYRILEQWGDLKPKRCSGRKGSRPCGVSFRKNPEMLEITLPKKSTSKKVTKKRSKNVRSETTS